MREGIVPTKSKIVSAEFEVLVESNGVQKSFAVAGN
jgi:hypothetical protein